MEAIRTERLTRRFGRLTAVNEVTLQVGRGEMFGLVGPDGAGKSTMMRLLAGVLKPTAGEAWVLDCQTVRDARRLKARTAYVPQRGALYPDLTVQENLEFYADLYTVSDRERSERFARVLEFSRLGPFRRRLAGRLSGGMQQKLALGCALMHGPELLLLDEPTCGVDPVSRRELWRILSHLVREGVTVFLSTAYLDEAERCNRVALLHLGRLLACGEPAELKRSLRRSVVEVRTKQTRDAYERLQEQAADLQPTMFGDTVHLLCDDAAGAKERVHAALGGTDIRVEAVSVQPPSLEDVFVAASQQRLGGEQE
jgi:ABC-2 type transport system ATP-binding protein